jgi:hypothetical protein
MGAISAALAILGIKAFLTAAVTGLIFTVFWVAFGRFLSDIVVFGIPMIYVAYMVFFLGIGTMTGLYRFEDYY